MEMDEMKAKWQSLDERLKKQQTVKEHILRKILYSNISKNKRNSIWGSVLGLVGSVFLLIMFTNWLLTKHMNSPSALIYVLYAISMIFFVAEIIFIVRGMSILSQLDFSASASRNMQVFNRFNLLFRQRIITGFVALPLVCAYMGFSMFTRWGQHKLTGIAILIIISGLVALGMYYAAKKSMKKMNEALEDMKELEEEDHNELE